MVTAVAQVTAMAWVRSLVRELPHAKGMAKKKKKNWVQLDTMVVVNPSSPMYI